MSGYLETLSPNQESILQKLKENVADVLTEEHDDRRLLQFLRARRFDLEKTEQMFRKHVCWRRKYPKKFLLEEWKPSELMDKYLASPFLGFDKEGSPIRVVLGGAYDVTGMMSAFQPEELSLYFFHLMEKDRAATKEYNEKFGCHVEAHTWIIDYRHLKLKPLMSKTFINYNIALLQMYEANYPEMMKVAYIINIPYFFSFILNIIKSVADERTVGKFRIYGEHGWREDMLKHIDADILPDWLGHPNYISMYGIPTFIPEHYYLRNQNKLQKDAENVHQLTLKRRSRKEIPVVIESIGSTIVWYVECPDGDINVGLYHKKQEDTTTKCDLEETVPFAKAGGDFGPYSGSYTNTESGSYFLVFDNSFSIIRSKHIMYTFDVIPPVSGQKITQCTEEKENFCDANNH